jgi:2-dehydropantoate 2-reductase
VRFVVIGAGAIGGVVGARLTQAGREVMLIARGSHYEAIASDGLTLETPTERVTLQIPVVRAPREVDFAPDDVVLLATKSQDTQPALQALRDVAPTETPVVCLQNGVENERVALRLFPKVYGAVVMSPTAHLHPGVVQAYGAALTGQIDIGCYPSGADDLCQTVCDALRTARFASEPQADIMRSKHAKLIANLANAVQAICGDDAGSRTLIERVREEGREVLRAAGIEFEDEHVSNLRGRWESWEVGEIAGSARAGGSTWQSIARGTGSVETDYLNGEIVFQGRRIGMPTPVNELLQALAQQSAREQHEPGWLSSQDVLSRLEGGDAR